MLHRSLRRHGIRFHRLVIPVALVITALLALSPSPTTLMLLLGAAGFLIVVNQPDAGLVALVLTAFSVPLEFGLGNAFTLSGVHLLLPALALLCLLRRALGRRSPPVRSSTFAPLLVLLLATGLSWLYGNVTWDPRFPRHPDLYAIQAAQWVLYALCILAYVLAAQQSWRAVRWASSAFLGMGAVALLHRYGGSFSAIGDLLTTGAAQTNGTFFVWMTALAGGQALFNQHIQRGWRAVLFLLALSVPLLGLWQATSWASSWLPPLVVLGALVVLRSYTLGVVLLVVVIVALLLWPGPLPGRFVWESERISVEGRLVLWRSVIQLGWQQPLFGLGLTTYRQYHVFVPLLTDGPRWNEPSVNSHNLYIDLFAQLGLVGLAAFLWAVAKIGLLAWRLRGSVTGGFEKAYVNGALAGLGGMLFASGIVEWLMPFVYNTGLRALRFSVFSWVFLGGLVALQNGSPDPTTGDIIQ